MSKRNSQAPINPVTIGMLRAEGKRLHITCGNCGHEREPLMTNPPFDKLPDDLPVPEVKARVKLKCGARGCGEKEKIWVQTENPGASENDRRAWGWTEEEIAAAGPPVKGGQ